MSIRRTQILEGIGEVRSGNRVIENITYQLAVHREFQENDSSAGQGVDEISGRIEGGIQGDQKLPLDLSAPKQLTLEMKDGSKVDFYLESMGSGRIVVAGPIYRDDSY